MAETLTISVAASADDGHYFNSSASITAQWMQIGSHTNESIGPWTGFRFQINSTLAAINTADITDVRVQLRSNVAGTFSGYWRVQQTAAAAFATSGSNRADQRYNSIGSTGQVLQGSTSVGAASDFQSSDLSARVISALDALNEGDYIGIVCGVDPSVAGNYYVDCASWDHVSAPAPKLVITYDPPTNDEVAPEGIDTTEVFGSPALWQSWTGISYHDGVGSSTSRTLDVFTPTGPPPRLGWPTVVWTHGGSFAGGSRSDLGDDIKKAATDAGFAIVSIDYKLSLWDWFFNTNTGWTHPYPVSDYLCAIKWLANHAGRYGLDPSRFVAAGYSAGGHIALEAALLAEDATPDVYEMVYQGASTTQGRYADYPEMDITQGRTRIPRIRGFFGWGSPVSLTETYVTTLAPDFIDAYWGALPSTTGTHTVVGKEGNINAFLTAESGTVYEDRTPGPPSFPIGYCYDTTDIVVTTSAGYAALYNALNTVGGYSIGAASGVIDLDGLSRYSYAGIGHDYVVNVNTVAFFGDWLEALRDDMTDQGQLWPRPSAAHADSGQTWPRG